MKTVLVVLGGLGLAGCASSGGGASSAPRAGPTYSVAFRSDALPVRRVVAAAPDSVWAALPRAFSAMGYPGGPSTRSGERWYLTPAMTPTGGTIYQGKQNSLYLDCGRSRTGLAADEYEIAFAILARIFPQRDGGTLVEILVDGTARDRTSSSNSVFCSGTGVIEGALLDRLERLLRS